MNEPKRKIILLAEKRIHLQRSEAQKLERFGYEVVTADSGEQAIRLATRDEAVDLVLLSIDSGPVMDGAITAEAILAQRNLPIVFLAARPDPECLARVKGIPRYGFVTTDMDEALLRSSIEGALDLFAAHRETERLARRGRAVFQVQPDMMFVVDRDGYYRDFFHAPEPDQLALPTDRIIGSSIRIVFSAEESERQLALYRVCLETGTVQTSTYQLTVQGRLRTFDLRIARLDEMHVLAIIRDITESRQAADMLRESEETMRYIVKHDPNAIAVFDRELRYLAVSDRYLQDYGVQADDLIGRQHYEVFPEMPQRWMEVHRRSLAGAVERNEDDWFERPDGSITYNRWECRPWYRSDGSIGGIITYTEVTTERKLAEKALRESEERLRLVLKGSNDGWWDWNLEKDAIYYSARWMQMLGYEADELSTDPRQWPRFTCPDDFEHVRNVIGGALESGQDYFELEIRLTHRDGRFIPVLARGFILRDDSGKPIRVSGVNTDVTQLKEAETRIRSLLEEKELLLKEVHHRVKNNMNTMRSLLSMQSFRSMDESAARVLQEAAGRLQSMEVLYDRLYRAENLRQLSLQDYLPSLVHEVVNLFPASASVDIRTRIDDISLDVQRLSTLGIIVNELLSNIMKHAFPPGKSGVISVTAEKREKTVRVSIADNGEGLPEDIDFEHSGGFGLQLVGLLVRQIRGSIRIERAGGTGFILDFEG